MKKRRWIWALFLLPVVAILLGIFLPTNDDFAEIAQRGIPISADQIGSVAIIELPSTNASDLASSLPRVRVWQLPDSAGDISSFLKGRGFSQSGMSISESSMNGVRTFESRTDYWDSNLGTQAVVYEGMNVPAGSRCILEVREPTGLSMSWRRFVARMKRGISH